MTDKDTAGIMRAFISREVSGGSRLKIGPNPRYADSHRARTIAQIRSRAVADMAEIRKNDSLTEKGKAQALAFTWKTSNDAINSLAKAERDEQIRRYNSIEQQLFGATKVTGADAEAARNATAIADSLSGPNAALAALDDAARNGDATLARAVAYKSWQNGWNNVIDQYTDSTPSVRDRLTELSDLQDHLNSTTVFSNGVRKPAELNKVPLAELDQYAGAMPQNTIQSQLDGRFSSNMTPQQEKDLRAQAVADARGEAQ